MSQLLRNSPPKDRANTTEAIIVVNALGVSYEAQFTPIFGWMPFLFLFLFAVVALPPPPWKLGFPHRSSLGLGMGPDAFLGLPIFKYWPYIFT